MQTVHIFHVAYMEFVLFHIQITKTWRESIVLATWQPFTPVLINLVLQCRTTAEGQNPQAIYEEVAEDTQNPEAIYEQVSETR